MQGDTDATSHPNQAEQDDPARVEQSVANTLRSDSISTGDISGIGIAIGAGSKVDVTISEEQAYHVDGLRNPYLGLRAFTYDDRESFAGRELLVSESIARISSPGDQRTLLFITGASGSGKSSFAQAGLLPALEKHYAER